MLLRNGKRKIFLEDEPSRKKRRLSQSSNKLLLYINDVNTYSTELKSLRNVGNETAKLIFDEKRKRPFASEQDLINRIRGITAKSIENSPVQIIFKTRFEEQSELIYNTLLNISWMKASCDELNILKIIAQQAVGKIVSCDNHKCNENVMIYDHKSLYHTESEKELAPKHSLLYSEDDCGKKIYYHRKSKQFGDAVYCYKCTPYLRHCNECKRDVYFINDHESHNICLGIHIDIIEWDNGTIMHVPVEHRMCQDCQMCTFHDFFGPLVTITGHRYQR